MDHDGQQAPPVPAFDSPAYWDVIYTYGEAHADAHGSQDAATLTAVAATVYHYYGALALADLAAIALARVRLLDPLTPGSTLTASLRDTVRQGLAAAPASCRVPYPEAAFDQAASALSAALDLGPCDARSLAANLRTTLEGSPQAHAYLLASIAGGLLLLARAQ